MKRKIIVILVILLFLLSCGIIYLNQVVLPTKVKALIVRAIEDATQKKVSLSSLKFSIFKGLVLRDLNIYDDTKTILKIKETSCTFLILPIFKKQLIIPAIKLKSPEIFVQRRADNSLNILDPFFRKSPPAAKSNFNLFVYKINLIGGQIHFQDDTLQPVFAKEINNLNLLLHLSLPARIKFKLKFEIPQRPDLPMRVNSSGEYKILAQELAAKITVKDLSPKEFNSYYGNPWFSIPEGKIDALINLGLKKDKMLNADLDAQSKGIILSKDELLIKLNSNITANLNYSLKNKQLSYSGKINIIDSDADGIKFIERIGDIKGEVKFSNAAGEQLIWSGLNFRCLDTDYKTSGVLTNFQAPGVQLELSSGDLFLESSFAINGKEVDFSKFSGKYINSEFSFIGDIDATDFSSIKADINAGLNIDLNDIKEPLKKFKDKIESIKPSGVLQVRGNLKGNINDIKSCAIEAKFSSNSLSLWGLKSGDFLLNYSQQGGIANIPLMHLSLYDGSIDAIGEINLTSENLPYWLSADIKGIKLEKLKLDTPARDKDISGAIQAQAKINGFSGDLSRLNGAGTIIISDGRLWQLNLFKGIGTMLFSSDFTNIVFSEGSCGFVIQDKYILTDNLRLKSNLSDISGVVKIGFDSSIDAALNVEVSDEAPLTGTIKDITTAILGAAKRFAVIRITGTLKEPEYKFKPAIVDILKSLKDTFLNK